MAVDVAVDVAVVMAVVAFAGQSAQCGDENGGREGLGR